jgi:hypothetical protein
MTSMKGMILEARGVFWWHDHAIPEGCLTPGTSITGLLSINDDGHVKLELDGVMSGVNNIPIFFTDKDIIGDRCIQGLLIKENKNVLLCNLMMNGGSFKSGGVSHENYFAGICLIGDSQPIQQFKFLNIELLSFNDWFRQRSINCKRTRNTIKVSHKRKSDICYKLKDGVATIRRNIYGPQTGTHTLDSLSINESVSIIYNTDTEKTIGDMINLHRSIEDFFFLLTDYGNSLDWPKLSLTKKSTPFTCYYTRRNNTTESFEWQRSPTNFILINEYFGTLLDNWKIKRAAYSSAFDLFLGAKSGAQIYVEHRFVNLIWGLESLHRKKNKKYSATSLDLKIHRILNNISIKKDKKWLKKKLQYAAEPSLKERIYDVLCSLNLGFDKKNVGIFSEKCATMRNEISHFGELHQGASYKESVIMMSKINQVLTKLYHAILLKEIGLSDESLKSWIYNDYYIKTYLGILGFTKKDD